MTLHTYDYLNNALTPKPSFINYDQTNDILSIQTPNDYDVGTYALAFKAEDSTP